MKCAICKRSLNEDTHTIPVRLGSKTMHLCVDDHGGGHCWLTWESYMKRREEARAD